MSSYSIKFSDLHYIDYTYQNLPTSFVRKGLRKVETADCFESFRVALIDLKGDYHYLCSYKGEGPSINSLAIFMEYSGTQENESKNFVLFLEKILGIPLGKPSYL